MLPMSPAGAVPPAAGAGADPPLAAGASGAALALGCATYGRPVSPPAAGVA